MERLSCPVCRGRAEHLFDARDENRRVTEQTFPYARCSQCRCIFLSRVPANPAQYYREDYYQIPSPDRLRRIGRRHPYRIDLIRKFSAGRVRLLEIGPAYGMFALQAKDAGFDVAAIEADHRCCEYLRNRLQLEVIQSNEPHVAIRELPQHGVIAVWHALEHLPDPVGFLTAACLNLGHGGLLAVAVPNPQALQFRIMGRHWPHLDAPRHVCFLPVDTLSNLVRSMGLVEVYRSTSDIESRSWNRFGWRYLLMNRFRNAWFRKSMSLLGFLPALLFSPFEHGMLRGSAYTVLFRKP